MEEFFFNSSEEIVQRLELRSENAVHMQEEQRSVDWHVQFGVQQQFGHRPIDRGKDGRPSGQPTGTSFVFSWGSVDRPVDRRKGRSTERSTNRYICWFY